MDIIQQHRHQLLLLKDTIQVVRTSPTFLTNLIDLLSVLACMISTDHHMVNDGSSSRDRDYDELIASHDHNGFPLDRSSCEPVDIKALSQAQIIQQVDESYTRWGYMPLVVAKLP